VGTRGIDQQKGGSMNKPACDKCGSDDDVYVQSISYYSAERATWVREAFCDVVHCGKCGNEAVELPEQFKTGKIK
jgi:predicted nucleic-acid-binding Zn-ribbon protein